MKRYFFIAVLIFSFSFSAFSQEKQKIDAVCGMDAATMYLWRGFELGKGPVIQPWGQLNYTAFSLGVWSSTNFTGSFQEIDIYAKYQYKKLTLSFTDLFFPGYESLDQNYFNWRNSSTGHAAEFRLSYDFGSKIPLVLSAGVILYGKSLDANPDDIHQNNYSSYFEARYNGTVRQMKYSVFLGMTPDASLFYATDGFSFINTGISLEKSIHITESFDLPAKITLAANPAAKKVFVVFQISI